MSLTDAPLCYAEETKIACQTLARTLCSVSVTTSSTKRQTTVVELLAFAGLYGNTWPYGKDAEKLGDDGEDYTDYPPNVSDYRSASFKAFEQAEAAL